jgi:hypothetical protein
MVLFSKLQLQLRLVPSAAKPAASTLPAIRFLFVAFDASSFARNAASRTPKGEDTRLVGILKGSKKGDHPLFVSLVKRNPGRISQNYAKMHLSGGGKVRTRD